MADVNEIPVTITVNEEDRLKNPSETSKSQQYDAEHVEGATCFTDDNASSLESYPIVTGVLSDVDESMLALHFEDVIEAIDQLFKLASQIRSPTSRKLRTDVDLYRDIDADVKSTYIRVREAAELQGIEQVFLQTRRSPLGDGDENPDGQLGQEDVVLVRRLQKANRLRRQQFEYWKRSKEKLVRATSKAEQNLDFLAKEDTPKVQAQAKAPIQTALSVTQASQQLSSLPSSVPIVARDLVLKDNKSTYSGVSRGLTVHGPSGEILSWPKPPHPKEYGKDFECPYCFFICPPKYLSSEAAWRFAVPKKRMHYSAAEYSHTDIISSMTSGLISAPTMTALSPPYYMIAGRTGYVTSNGHIDRGSGGAQIIHSTSFSNALNMRIM